MGLLGKLFRPDGPQTLPPPTYSNEAVISRIEREEGVDRQTARTWFAEMLVFLDLCAGSPEVLSPPKDVDKAWHAFLLHSRDYEAYCRERFGRLIHHQPTEAPDPEAYRRAYAQRTQYGTGTPADAAVWTVPVGDGRDATDRDRSANGGGGSCGGAPAVGDGTWDGGGGSFGSDSSGGSGGGGDSGSGGDAGGGSSCGGGGCGGGS